MDSFKLRVVLGEVQIELEGNEGMVQSIFSQICENGLGILKQTQKQINSELLTDKNEELIKTTEQNTCQDSSLGNVEANDFPSLANIVLQEDNKTEAEWILVYALYCSEFGNKLFTEEDLRMKYDETKRVTDARKKNFKANIKSLVAKKYIAAFNDSHFKISKDGLDRAKIIILQGQGDKPSNTKIKKGTGKKQTPKYEMKEIILSELEKNDLREFWNKHDHNAHMDKAVLIAYWLKTKKNFVSINPDFIFTILRCLGESASFDLASSLRNAKNKKSYFNSGSESNFYSINHIGEDHVKEIELKDKTT